MRIVDFRSFHSRSLQKVEEVKIPFSIRMKFANELKFIDTSSRKS